MTNEQISAMDEIKRIFKKYKTGAGEKCFHTKAVKGKIKKEDLERVNELATITVGISKEFDDYYDLHLWGDVWGGPDLIEIDEDGNRVPYKFDE